MISCPNLVESDLVSLEKGFESVSMYIRFVIAARGSNSLAPIGIFHAIGKLRDRGDLSPEDEARVRELTAWFNNNLERPARLRRNRKTHRKNKAISWFRDSAAEHISRIREYMSILQKHGILVRMVSTEHPGYIVYQDDYQVTAEPFSDTDTG